MDFTGRMSISIKIRWHFWWYFSPAWPCSRQRWQRRWGRRWWTQGWRSLQWNRIFHRFLLLRLPPQMLPSLCPSVGRSFDRCGLPVCKSLIFEREVWIIRLSSHSINSHPNHHLSMHVGLPNLDSGGPLSPVDPLELQLALPQEVDEDVDQDVDRRADQEEQQPHVNELGWTCHSHGRKREAYVYMQCIMHMHICIIYIYALHIILTLV